MSNTHLPVSEYIKQGIFIIAVIAIALFGIKSCRKFQKKRQIVVELSTHASESAAYEQFYQDNARENLFRAMLTIHQGVELGMTPAELIDQVLNKDEGEMFSTETPDNLSTREELIREALLSNYDNCRKLGIFDNALNLDALKDGEFPTIGSGPSEGDEVIIDYIIPSYLLPGAEKMLPNLSIAPPLPADYDSSQNLSAFAIARSKQLAKQLAEARLIEKEVYKKVLDYYETITKQPLVAPKTEDAEASE
ncbi:hypothetical protein JO972_00855 [Verrucomicrobiaceae bacterium 5K15]|uniref:Uncharacterized protein n=1 Tax=Oceaniferula flava TaxID=2800421 RepID=A0AAE2VCP1_9BACT|nr:hypothetical protein [Oceaniferula flavus]MBK1853499.1 hypothetical protein [Oceaniferula flavus]MBM1134804.1 hypothetical protein [Oceaniferula flavus]